MILRDPGAGALSVARKFATALALVEFTNSLEADSSPLVVNGKPSTNRARAALQESPSQMAGFAMVFLMMPVAGRRGPGIMLMDKHVRRDSETAAAGLHCIPGRGSQLKYATGHLVIIPGLAVHPRTV